MKVAKSHYSKFLISVQFDRGFVPDTLSGKVEMCENFLSDLGELAHSNGRRLHATYSVCIGKLQPHAHFAVSWLPLVKGYLKTAKTGNRSISRYAVIEMLESNFFFVDNPQQAIKIITHDKPYVTNYVINQPKDGQSAIYSAFYVHPIFRPAYSEIKIQSYCSKCYFSIYQMSTENYDKNKVKRLVLISAAYFTLISLILLSLF